MKVLVTGANGFVARNLLQHLSERKDVDAVTFTRLDDIGSIAKKLEGVEYVFHLAGVNRPQNEMDFIVGNQEFTKTICEAVLEASRASGKRIPILYTSSTQAASDSPYGVSKKRAEDILLTLSRTHGLPVRIYRLPNVFGKWCKPNYNSAVATFCFNIARGLPIKIHDPAAKVTLVYVDDVVSEFICSMTDVDHGSAAEYLTVAPEYTITVGEMAGSIERFHNSRNSLVTERVGEGLSRALYSTYLSYLPPESFSYPVPMHSDNRGTFVEMLKTLDSGQFSYFTARPGMTRGGHYHHTKTEKFLVIKGDAHFRFRHTQTDQCHELKTSGDTAQVVESIPGWTHDITNIGTDDMFVLLWANEVFDRSRPDTITCPLLK